MTGKKFLHTLLLLSMLAVLSGCGSKQVALTPEFWQDTGSRIAIILDTPAHGELYQRGDQGAIEIFITDTMYKEGTYANSLTETRFAEIGEAFQRELAAASFNAFVDPNEIDIEKLPKLKGRKKGAYEYDLSEIFEATNCDRIILLNLIGFGVCRHYTSLIPISKPEGVAMAHGLMIDRKDNRILWDSDLRDKRVCKEIEGEWNEPPGYPNMTNAIERAIEECKIRLTQKFFRDRLSDETVDSWVRTLAELKEPNATSVRVQRYLWGMEAVNPAKASCKYPYKVDRDCSGWSGAVGKIVINGVRIRTAGSEDGTAVMIQGHKRVTTNGELAVRALEQVIRVLEANEIKIQRVVGIVLLKESREMQGYYLKLDKDGYSILQKYAEDW